MGFSMGKSESSQQSQSQQASRSWQNVYPGQAPYLEALYGRGAQMLDQVTGGQQSPWEQPAMSAWARMLEGGMNPHLPGMVREAQARAGEGFAENVLPALQQSAIASGNLGGTRGNIAAGMAAREAVRDQGRIATELYGRGFESSEARALQALGLTGGLAQLSASSFAPLLAYAQLLGRPTVLGGSESSGSSWGQGSSEAWNIAGSMTGMT